MPDIDSWGLEGIPGWLLLALPTPAAVALTYGAVAAEGQLGRILVVNVAGIGLTFALLIRVMFSRL